MRIADTGLARRGRGPRPDDARILAAAGRFGEGALALAILAVVVMMVVPLRPWMADLLVGANLALAFLLLGLALFVERPLAFSAFPTLLLVATLYRLALNVSTTRLILTRADAGRIIAGFGGFVVGGDILVGAVIFGTLSLMLFLVITKGAERVAEVAARFALDALPGMQLAIDADLRAGSVSPSEARRRRAELDARSRYFGSLDGAMKFVRGDAVACLAITVVNIAGGLLVGTLRRGMSIGEALDLYGRLAVGDGLVTQIPSLLTATAAGLLVTRVGAGHTGMRLGRVLAKQLGAEPRALAATAALMIILAAVPHFPAWPFLLLAALLGAGAALALRREGGREEDAGAVPFAAEEPLRIASVRIAVGADLSRRLEEAAWDRGGWPGLEEELGAALRRDLGLPVAALSLIRDEGAAGEQELALIARGVPRGRVGFPPGCVLVEASAERLRGIGVAARAVLDGAAWIGEPDAALARAARLTVREPLAALGWIAKRLVCRAADAVVGVDEADAIVERLAGARPALVRETVPRVMGLSTVARLLADLLRDGISLRHIDGGLERVARLPAGAAPDLCLQKAREGLASVITAKLLDGRESLPLVVLGPELEAVLAGSLVAASDETRLVLAEDVAVEAVAAVGRAVNGADRAALAVRADLRRPLRDRMGERLGGIAVVSLGELEPDTPVELLGRAEL